MLSIPRVPSRRTAIVVALLGLLAVSHSVLFIRLADAPAVTIAFMRVLVGTLVFAPFGAAALRTLDALDPGIMRRAVLLSLGSGAFLAGHFASWIASMQRVSIAESMVLVSLTPIWIVLIDAALGRGAPGRVLAGAIALCLAGTAVLGFQGAQRVDGDLLGLGLATAGGVCMAVYLTAGRTARQHLPVTAYVTLCYGSATAWLLAGALLGGVPLGGFGGQTWAAMIALGLVSQVIGHTSYNWTLGTLPPVFVAVCLLGEPILGAVFGLLYLGEAIPPGAAAGGALILAGLGLALAAELRKAG
ncbi:MAG: DMT family transporter [Alphaproteobacteria bacterium]|nr:DMT family transporter [Alphaproteobacteria bacterium]MDX5367960.1 DMT family transporter [Alphaproteobacteria bacterium]MDX5462813.1 DMT family transporter [Alphaproteobacteria bacterium]